MSPRAGLWLVAMVIAAQLHCAIPAAAPQTWEVLTVAASACEARRHPLAFLALGRYGSSGARTLAPLCAEPCAAALCRAPRDRSPCPSPSMLQGRAAGLEEPRRGHAWSAPSSRPPCITHGSFSRFQPQGLSHGRGRGGHVLLAAPLTSRKSELLIKEVKNVDGVDVNIKLESLGGNRRRISGGHTTATALGFKVYARYCDGAAVRAVTGHPQRVVLHAKSPIHVLLTAHLYIYIYLCSVDAAHV